MRKIPPILLISIVICFIVGCRSLISGTETGKSPNSGGETQTAREGETQTAREGETQTAQEGDAAGPGAEIRLRDDPLWSDDESLKAMIISDLHYTEYKEADPLLVPGVAIAPEITDVIAAEVIDRHPDVLIMTGDNTNGGYSRDVEGLLPKLQKIKDSGVSIILTTGNHDYDLMDAEEFEKAYFGLLDPTDRDPASLSYTAIIGDVVFLAMDDNAMNSGVQGEFSEETMRWLGEMLEKYEGCPIIFLSHHNVLYGYGEEGSESHVIQNPELPDLLRENGVKLALTGHMHFQYVTQRDGLWEILSGMPFSGRHLIGSLAVGKDAAGKGRIIYYAEPVDFAAYDNAVKEELDRLDRESAEYMDGVFSGLLDREGLRGSKKRKVLELIDRFFDYFYAGTLAAHTKEIKEDPSYEPMINALWKYNYGPWMQTTIETTEYSAAEVEISW